MSNLFKFLRLVFRIVDLLTDIRNLLAEGRPPQQTDEDNWMGNKDVMRKYDYSERSLARYRKEKVLPHTKVKGRVYYREADILNLLKQNYQK